MAAQALPAAAQSGGPQALIQNALGEGQRFEAGAVTELARALSRRPFAPPPNDLPEPFAGLSYERYVAIRALPTGRIWHGENRGFVVEPLPRGFVFTTGVSLFTVEDGQIRRVVFDKSRFDFGGLAVPPNAPDPGFSGMRLESVAGGQPFEFALIQGATFFRAAARGQNFGIVARGLVLKAAEVRGEEFPIFRAFWIERPVPGTNAIVVNALLDSESVAGAVRMTFRPGEATIVDVETTLFPRVALEHVGIGGMGAAFLFGPNVRRGTEDIRPAVYDASGLSMLNGQGEWLWRPLNNPDTLQTSAFMDDNPRGFGLIQRERDFAHFQDDAQRFERRPSLWIEPIGDWGQGSVQMIEIPSDSEINKNILAYWRPRAAMAAGSEITLSYRQFWSWTPPDRPQLATVWGTRSGRAGSGRRRRFLVEFGGDGLAAPIPDLRATLTASPGTILNHRVWAYPDRKTVRVAFDLDPGNENASEMRLVLQSGAKPLSETWLYRWTP
ncbi:glucan biosynthesis protein [Enterovirga sp.]|uniref:glucan biosynthesis protein n=1 Tax=Enterovirga sp. TaxID=2026350 RepID=UPI00261575F3|nr:glucan biosynthesis protein [Enterovirga sp.]